MKRIGIFYDRFIEKDYDLYFINARELKKYVQMSYKLTPLKINMFNGGTNVKDEIETETRYANLSIDYKNGEINNLEEYTQYKTKEDRPDFRYNLIKDAIETTENINNNKNDYHLIGFELNPIAISLKNKDISQLPNVELLDGFKRMFWTMSVPDEDIFVKVYDVLDTKEWSNAMLLFNSWKTSIGPETLFDRGFKLGLYKHFGLDVTLYDNRSLRLIYNYISKDPYLLLKDNPIIDKDIEILLKLFNEYAINQENISLNNTFQYLLFIAKIISNIRKVEQNIDRKANSKVIPFELIKNFLNKEQMKKHITKINSMNTPGHIDNYIQKNMLYPTFILLRQYYGINDNLPEEYMEHPVYFKNKPEYFFTPVEELNIIFEKYKQKMKEIENKSLKY